MARTPPSGSHQGGYDNHRMQQELASKLVPLLELAKFIVMGDVQPEGHVEGQPGALYIRKSGGLFRKAEGHGKSGWEELQAPDAAVTPGLSDVLEEGATTGGTDLTISTGDQIVGATSVNLRTHSGFTETALQIYTHAGQHTITGSTTTMLVSLLDMGPLPNARIAFFNVTMALRQDGVAAASSYRCERCFTKGLTGTVGPQNAHMSSKQGSGTMDGNLTFSLVVDSNVIKLQVVNASATDYTVNLAAHWTVQVGGQTS
jgi:hypothetical protein